MSFYVFDLMPDDNGTFLATCDAFPEIATYVDEVGDLFFTGPAAVEEAIAARIADERDIPDSASKAEIATVGEKADGTVRAWVPVPHLTDLKVLLYRAMRGERVTRADLQRRLGWKRESVDRLFRLDHKSKVEQIEAALLVLGLELVTATVEEASPERVKAATAQRSVSRELIPA